jgi:hypothetical protein
MIIAEARKIIDMAVSGAIAFHPGIKLARKSFPDIHPDIATQAMMSEAAGNTSFNVPN